MVGHDQAITSLPTADVNDGTSFNCLLPAFTCGQYSECNQFNGKCSCPPGFGGDDCLSPGMAPSSFSRASIPEQMLTDPCSLWLLGRWQQPPDAQPAEL